MNAIVANALHLNASKCLVGLTVCLFGGESVVILLYQSDIFTNREVGEQRRLSRNLNILPALLEKPLDVFIVFYDFYSD